MHTVGTECLLVESINEMSELGYSLVCPPEGRNKVAWHMHGPQVLGRGAVMG